MSYLRRGFLQRVVVWQRVAGRHNLPWQGHDAYLIWVSEVMLQQTQVAAVIPYFQRFVARFPDVTTLASAPVNDVLAHWAGLGYYARARNLHAAAKMVVHDFDGQFPRSAEMLQRLPGVGRSTANAIAALSVGARVPILDGNVKRVLARHAGIDGYPGDAPVAAQLWRVATAHVTPRASAAQMRAYTQGMMDLGAMICLRRNPLCQQCPVHQDCVAHAENRIAALPTPRPKKTLPHRRTTVAVVQFHNEVFVVARPAMGIWGGLFSLPEIEGAPRDWAHETLSIPAAQFSALPEVSHGFTHFNLTLAPHHLRVARRPKTLPPNGQWFALDALETDALPAPIKRLLQSVASPNVTT